MIVIHFLRHFPPKEQPIILCCYVAVIYTLYIGIVKKNDAIDAGFKYFSVCDRIFLIR
jgi:hypothetical protein